MHLFLVVPATMPSLINVFSSLPDPTSFLMIGLGLAGVGLLGSRKATDPRRK